MPILTRCSNKAYLYARFFSVTLWTVIVQFWWLAMHFCQNINFEQLHSLFCVRLVHQLCAKKVATQSNMITAVSLAQKHGAACSPLTALALGSLNLGYVLTSTGSQRTDS
ncbi:hypothetical protein XENTR_v10019172 [Xenopus tropicalis]|nr:hypothetical protein XENTR_v10019172 [Xenopus tropicalis]